MFDALRRLRARTPLENAITEWLTRIQYLSIGTQKGYKQVIMDFSATGHHYLENITVKDISTYITQIAWTRKKSTANKYLKVLKAFFNFAEKEYSLFLNPAKDIRKFKEDMPHQPFVSKTQYELILSKATQRESDIIRLLANTGLRASELCNLKPENISPNLSSLRILGKGNKVRTIPCNATVREILSRDINLPKSRKSIYNICTKAGSRLDIALPPHVLRRYFATSLLNAGVSLLIISYLLSHSSIRTTELYLKLDSSFLAGSTDVLD